MTRLLLNGGSAIPRRSDRGCLARPDDGAAVTVAGAGAATGELSLDLGVSAFELIGASVLRRGAAAVDRRRGPGEPPGRPGEGHRDRRRARAGRVRGSRAVISPEELEKISQSYKRTAGFEAEALNNRPSLGVARHGADGRRTGGGGAMVARRPPVPRPERGARKRTRMAQPKEGSRRC
jgi:hypothetical protein